VHDAKLDAHQLMASPQVPNWQLYHGPLDNMTIKQWMFLIYDVILTILPLLFVGLAIAIARLDGQSESAWGYAVMQASILGPTIWPILFAAVVGSTLQYIALYQAECGTTFGVGVFFYFTYIL
jgi:hypothetical protein